MRLRLAIITLLLAAATQTTLAQQAPGGPPAVGVVTVAKRSVTETSNFVGRVVAVDKVEIVARVTAFIAERTFDEGAEVDKGDLLYRLERAPFEADLAAKQAAVQQNMALLRNATITLGRAQSLLNTPAGQRSTVDDRQATEASQAAQLLAAKAQLKASQINLDYTEIRSPIAGKIARSTVSVGNVVGPTSGALTTVVSQDPMYVVFPVSLRAALDLRNRYADKGGFSAITVRISLPDGHQYGIAGKLDYADPSVQLNTDTVNLRAVFPNPLRAGAKLGEAGNRELVDGSFAKVALEGVQPVEALSIPRSAVMSDQQGNFVYIVDGEKKAQIRRIQLGQSTPDIAVIMQGLAEGDTVIAEGLQRVRPGNPVNASPVSAGPTVPPSAPSAPAAPPATPAKG
jgi:membrane fusion protein (multidrug efflux system)